MHRLPEKVRLKSPEHGATEDSLSVDLCWESSSGADTYHVQVSTAEDFSAIYDEIGGLSRTTEPFNLWEATTYYWRVRGVNAAGIGPWSEIWSLARSGVLNPFVEWLNALNVMHDFPDLERIDQLIRSGSIEEGIEYLKKLKHRLTRLRQADEYAFDLATKHAEYAYELDQRIREYEDLLAIREAIKSDDIRKAQPIVKGAEPQNSPIDLEDLSDSYEMRIAALHNAFIRRDFREISSACSFAIELMTGIWGVPTGGPDAYRRMIRTELKKHYDDLPARLTPENLRAYVEKEVTRLGLA